MTTSRTLLHIDASAQLHERSHTRRLTRSFVEQWTRFRSQDKVIRRDVGRSPIPAIDHDWIAGAFTQPNERTPEMIEGLALSDALVDEVIASNVIVMGVPMYNYGLPTALKGWIDQVARIGRTFSFDLDRGDLPIEPILSGKSLVVLSARGEFGFEAGGPRAHLNALDPALAACAHYFGVARDDIHTVSIEYQEFKDERYRRSVTAAETATLTLAERLAAAIRDEAA
ncbi:FMN-dependent NADH-azoreductase [Algihabitans albus]|uniref:FMN-dependent NADH-azoreductase n=1 Tax=Algihabitans albus TaxID=2164067 RepID=UPI000E5CEB06|nr:NAD(P)H-dependent oxidoreductase [Algihabitans albus]